MIFFPTCLFRSVRLSLFVCLCFPCVTCLCLCLYVFFLYDFPHQTWMDLPKGESPLSHPTLQTSHAIDWTTPTDRCPSTSLVVFLWRVFTRPADEHPDAFLPRQHLLCQQLVIQPCARCLCGPQLWDHLQGYGSQDRLHLEHAKHDNELDSRHFLKVLLIFFSAMARRAALLFGTDESCDHMGITQQELYWRALKLINAHIPRYWIT